MVQVSVCLFFFFLPLREQLWSFDTFIFKKCLSYLALGKTKKVQLIRQRKTRQRFVEIPVFPEFSTGADTTLESSTLY